ncbi:hypothetical protein LVDJXP189_320018 [Flavobacterium psychrophilum]|nr:hypothetical protein LVDJXP189_320018 [Flavobacterium psychrophilum]
MVFKLIYGYHNAHKELTFQKNTSTYLESVKIIIVRYCSEITTIQNGKDKKNIVRFCAENI